MIIGISGYIGSGKDTVGSIIQYLDDKVDIDFKYWYSSNAYSIYNQLEKGWTIKKFAGKLKQIASLLTGIPVEKFEDQEFKKTLLSDEWNYQRSYPDETVGMTVREFLQRLGTEGIRIGVHTNAWVNALFADYQREYRMGPDSFDEPTRTGDYPNWIITDCRFPNEAQAIKDKGGVVIRVNRYEAKPDYQEKAALHPSETSLDTWKFDYTINNTGTIEELVERVKSLMKEIVGTEINNKD